MMITLILALITFCQDIIIMIFESCFPMKSLYSPNKKNLGKNWVTQGMQILSARNRVIYTIAPQ